MAILSKVFFTIKYFWRMEICRMRSDSKMWKMKWFVLIYSKTLFDTEWKWSILQRKEQKNTRWNAFSVGYWPWLITITINRCTQDFRSTFHCENRKFLVKWIDIFSSVNLWSILDIFGEMVSDCFRSTTRGKDTRWKMVRIVWLSSIYSYISRHVIVFRFMYTIAGKSLRGGI